MLEVPEEPRGIAVFVKEEVFRDADGPEFLKGANRPTRRLKGELGPLIRRIRGFFFDRLVLLTSPGDHGVRHALGVALLKPERIEELDEGVLV